MDLLCPPQEPRLKPVEEFRYFGRILFRQPIAQDSASVKLSFQIGHAFRLLPEEVTMITLEGIHDLPGAQEGDIAIDRVVGLLFGGFNYCPSNQRVRPV